MFFHELIIISIIFIILLLTYLYGYKFGKGNIKTKGEAHASRISNIQAGLMGLLGVMLAFSFSLSSQRFEQRRQLIIQESMNIGTAYFRVGLLQDTLKKELRSLLKIYLDERINFYKPGNTSDEMELIQKKSENLQVQIWAKTAEIGRKSPTLNTNLAILALNAMIDISGNISSSFQIHVPIFILILLTFMTMCTVMIIGYSHGLSSDRNVKLTVILIIILCSILLLIMDLDSPTTGFLKADIYGLVQLKNEILKYDR